MNTLHAQFNQILDRGNIPCFEYEISNGDYLLVDIQITDKQANTQGLLFSFDTDNKPVSFYGDIVTFENNNNLFLLPFDEYSEDLDYYLQGLYENIIEGYLIPNELI